MTKSEKLDVIRRTGVIAIMRADSSQLLMTAADALLEGGIQAMEVTMTTPGALRVIETAAGKYGDQVIFGAGSVIDVETARLAILSGAGFIVAPTLDVKVMRLCRRYSIPVFPGIFTPTEAVVAWENGADMVKLFPAGVGGPEMIKAMRAPLPQLEIIPVGGVDVTTAAAFIRSGAAALGVGSSLVNRELLDAGDMKEITRRGAEFIALVRSVRN
jgi:2-dehydro-3-deoxyphosphogluconate aldolase/(4S)-4-hydroxy-2-oxoglutarate aldolase